MKVLGIDPGSLKTGYAVIEEKSSLECLSSGVFDFSKEKNFYLRLILFKEAFEQLIQKYQPDIYSLEALIYVKSPLSLIKLAQTRGVILSTIPKEKKNCIFEFSPNTVKMTGAGHGFSSKEIVQKIMSSYFKKDVTSLDESDALAVALCYFKQGDLCTGFKEF